jgi:hypothetical protein
VASGVPGGGAWLPEEPASVSASSPSCTTPHATISNPFFPTHNNKLQLNAAPPQNQLQFYLAPPHKPFKVPRYNHANT